MSGEFYAEGGLFSRKGGLFLLQHEEPLAFLRLWIYHRRIDGLVKSGLTGGGQKSSDD